MNTPIAQGNTGAAPNLVHPKERDYHTFAMIYSILVWLALVLSVVGIFYALVWLVALHVAQGLLVASVKNNGVRVSAKQFPDLKRIADDLAERIGLAQTPEMFVVESGGVLNAFATRFAKRNVVVLYSHILELAYEQGVDALGFVIAHEFAHVQRKHVSLGQTLLLYPFHITPFLGMALSRAREYTCDRYGAHFVPSGAVSGLLCLAAGKRLYRLVDADAFAAQAQEPVGFWEWLNERLSTHPNLCKRVEAVAQFLARSGRPFAP